MNQTDTTVHIIGHALLFIVGRMLRLRSWCAQNLSKASMKLNNRSRSNKFRFFSGSSINFNSSASNDKKDDESLTSYDSSNVNACDVMNR